MASSDSLGQGRRFYQNEPLTARLKNLIHDYPEGVGIIKELIQNADDAGASRIEIIFDWRTHAFSKLPDPRMSELMGPAMLVYNDSTFSDRDFESIQTLGVSQKREDLQKTGRFGVGFNSVYHVTDYPSFISRDRIAFFDPHATAIPTTTKIEPGRIWEFAKEGWWKFPDFMRVYEPGGLKSGNKYFNGTLFRLPLRSPDQARRSEIRNQPFTEENVEELLDGLIEIGEELLLFLKSLVEIRVREIQADGSPQDLIAIVTQNREEVQSQREILRSPLQGDLPNLIAQCRSTPCPSISYLHKIETTIGTDKTSSMWRVCSLMQVDESDRIASIIRELAQQNQKAIPWAGAAACIARTGGTEPNFVGRAYCFLPLPQKTGLPVHINGFFDLDSSRRELTSDNLTGRDKIRVTWNQLLICHVLSHAYVNLITDLVTDIGETEPERFYQFLPTEAGGILSELPNAVFTLLHSKPIVRSAVPHSRIVTKSGIQENCTSHWIKPSEIKLLPERWQDLIAPLQADGIDLPEPPLPKAVQEAFNRAKCALKLFTPFDLRLHLFSNDPLGVAFEDVPRPSLSNRDWVILLLKYCLIDGHSSVRNLPLAILADGTLCTFGVEPHARLYDASDKLRNLFKDYPHWFLDADLVEQVPALRQCNEVMLMTPTEVAERLGEVIAPSDGEDKVAWKPNSETIPNAEWLAQVYDYLATEKEIPLDEFRKVPLVPGNDGFLHYPAFVSTPLWCGSAVDQKTARSFSYFQIPFVEASGVLQQSIAEFLKHHPERLIWNLTVPDLIDTLNGLNELDDLPEYDEIHYKKLVSFLASDRQWLQGEGDDDETRKEHLRDLPIYLTTNNQLTRLIDVYLPGGYEPPTMAGSVQLLRLGSTSSSQEWKPLFDFLKVPVLDRATLIQEHLVPNYASFSEAEQRSALAWIRDNLSLAQTQLDTHKQNSSQLKQLIQTSPLIRCTDEQLHPADCIYTPGSYNAVHQILGDHAATPDMAFYAEGATHWEDFFSSLGMLTTPSADDLIAHVDRLIAQSERSGVDYVADALMQFLSHIESNWQVLKSAQVNQEEQSFPESLRSRAWLPPERQEKNLKRYPGYHIPANRLCRADELHFIQSANLVASQKPLLRIQTAPERDIQKALGFVEVQVFDVVNHLKVLIREWKSNPSNIDVADLRRSLANIYRFLKARLANQNKEQNRLWLKDQLEGWNCLWDGERFWKPEHTFQENVSFFGRHRKKINNSEFKEIYEMLGQKQSPDLDDYLSFISELAEASNGEPLESEDAKCVIKVLDRVWHSVSGAEEETDLSNLLLLTEENLLIPAEEVLIPDAPWRLEGVRATGRVHLLHTDLYPNCIQLAKQAGSYSLSKDVVEQYKNLKVTNYAPARDLCRSWQRFLKSTEFRFGLLRLIADEHEIKSEADVDLDWLPSVQVLPAEEIVTDLYFGGNLIGENVPGDYYFANDTRTFYIRCDREDEDVMKSYLLESLNYQLGDFQLSENLHHLESILGIEPNRIQQRLDKKRIRPFLMKTANLTAEDENAEEDSIFPDDVEQEDSGFNTSKGLDDEQGTTPSTTKTQTTRTSQSQSNTHSSSIESPPGTSSSSQASSAKTTPAQRPASRNLGILGVKPPGASGSEPPETKERSGSGRGFGSGSRSQSSNSRPIPKRLKRSNSRSRSRSYRPAFNLSPRRGKLRSYVISKAQQKADWDEEENLSQNERDKIDRAGVARVMEYERSKGRTPEDMNEVSANFPGYDIRSVDPAGNTRYIEVKSKRGVWDGQGVKLTRTQFNESLAKQEQFWLYVVEQAEHDRDFKIFKIQNPACRVDEFYYDDGWKVVAVNDEQNSEVE